MSTPSSSERLWRVLVIGNSMPTIVHARTSRLEGPYPEVLEALLRGAGINAEVRNSSKENDVINRGVHRYQEDERGWSPDVLVVNYGMIEAQPPALPRGVQNHFMTWDTGMSRAAHAYRRRVAPRLWPQLRRYQRWAARRMGTHVWRMTPRRFAAELRRAITLARYDHRLTLVVDINPPGARLLANLPGVDARVEIMNGVLHDVVGKAAAEDPDVKLVEVSALAREMGVDEATPDGYHWSAEAQRHVAQMLADEIVPWIRSF